MNAAPPRRTDPEYISAMEHFESIPPEEIYAKTQQIDAAQILQASQVWLEAAGTIAASMPIIGNTSEHMMNSVGWEGAAADAARASARSFAAAMDELAEVMGEVGARLGAVAGAAEAVKLAVAPPGNSGPIGAVARALESAHVIDAQQAQEALRQEALMAMNMIYKPAYTLAGTGVPALPDPPALPGMATPSAPHSNHPAPQPHPPTTPHQQQPSQNPTPPTSPAPPQPTTPPAPAHPTTPPPPPPPTTPAPSPQSPPATRETTPAPQPPPPAPQSPSPPPPPAPAPPAGPPLNDPGGQPGITGPIPDSSTAPAPGQSGVSPDH